MTIAEAHCANHPAVGAVEICARCGSFLCGECVEYFRDETPVCSACLPLMEARPASVRAKVAPALSIFGLVAMIGGFLFPGRPGLLVWIFGLAFTLASFVVSGLELRSIGRQRSSSRGKKWVIAALIIATLAGLLIAGLVFSFTRFIRGAG